MEFTDKEIELIKKAEKSVKVSKVTRQWVVVTQLQFRSEHTCDQ